MKTTKQNKIPRQIVFTSQLNDIATAKAKRIGVSVPEYIRYLIIQDNSNQYNDIPMVSDETEALLAHSLQEYSKGNFTELKNAQEIKSHFENLAKTE